MAVSHLIYEVFINHGDNVSLAEMKEHLKKVGIEKFGDSLYYRIRTDIRRQKEYFESLKPQIPTMEQTRQYLKSKGQSDGFSVAMYKHMRSQYESKPNVPVRTEKNVSVDKYLNFVKLCKSHGFDKIKEVVAFFDEVDLDSVKDMMVLYQETIK